MDVMRVFYENYRPEINTSYTFQKDFLVMIRSVPERLIPNFVQAEEVVASNIIMKTGYKHKVSTVSLTIPAIFTDTNNTVPCSTIYLGEQLKQYLQSLPGNRFNLYYDFNPTNNGYRNLELNLFCMNYTIKDVRSIFNCNFREFGVWSKLQLFDIEIEAIR